MFKKNGTTTAGNSSQVTDGAAASLLMTRREAVRRGLPVLGVFRSFAVVGVDPAIMGVGEREFSVFSSYYLFFNVFKVFFLFNLQ